MRCRIDFTKYQGCGNDFILKDERTGRKTPDKMRSKIATMLCDRHFSVGADGVIFIEKSSGSDGSMRLFEPAGNEADMCGNGLRCVAAYLMAHLGKSDVRVMTRDGAKNVRRVGSQYRVDMGPVRTEPEHLREYYRDTRKAPGDLMDIAIPVAARSLRCSMVNTGEPHIVVRSERLGSEDVGKVGEVINADRKSFPKGVNINFVQKTGPNAIDVRTYERGVYDETLACGTGATASAAVAIMRGWVKGKRVKVHAVGGCLTVDLSEDGRAHMTGPAEPVFEGVVWVDA